MIRSLDTNLLFYALHEGMNEYHAARALIQEWSKSTDVVIAELVLAELYQLLRNPKLMGREVSSSEAVGVVQRFRHHPKWAVVEQARIMEQVWEKANTPKMARRRLFDIRLAFTLQHHGVTHFATANLKDFQNLGFKKVWNPLARIS